MSGPGAIPLKGKYMVPPVVPVQAAIAAELADTSKDLVSGCKRLESVLAYLNARTARANAPFRLRDRRCLESLNRLAMLYMLYNESHDFDKNVNNENPNADFSKHQKP